MSYFYCHMPKLVLYFWIYVSYILKFHILEFQSILDHEIILKYTTNTLYSTFHLTAFFPKLTYFFQISISTAIGIKPKQEKVSLACLSIILKVKCSCL